MDTQAESYDERLNKLTQTVKVIESNYVTQEDLAAMNGKLDTMQAQMHLGFAQQELALKNLIEQMFRAQGEAMQNTLNTAAASLRESIETKTDTLRQSIETNTEALRERIEIKTEKLRESFETKTDALRDHIDTRTDAMENTIALNNETMHRIFATKEEMYKAINQQTWRLAGFGAVLLSAGFAFARFV